MKWGERLALLTLAAALALAAYVAYQLLVVGR